MTQNTTDMAKKNTKKAKKWANYRIIIGVIALNLVVAAALLVGAYYSMKNWLNEYTQHGIEIETPNIIGLYPEEAEAQLSALGLKLQIIDSTFSQKTALGTFFEQNPKAGTKIKNGRTIYATRNASIRRPVIVPEIRDMSRKQAEIMLKSLGLEIGSYHYEASTYKDIILDVRVNNVTVTSGSELPEGTIVDLYIGTGPSDVKVSVPSLKGMKINEARTELINRGLTLGRESYDDQASGNSDKYYIYDQSPTAGDIVRGGSSIDVMLSLNIEKSITEDNTDDEETFF